MKNPYFIFFYNFYARCDTVGNVCTHHVTDSVVNLNWMLTKLTFLIPSYYGLSSVIIHFFTILFYVFICIFLYDTQNRKKKCLAISLQHVLYDCFTSALALIKSNTSVAVFWDSVQALLIEFYWGWYLMRRVKPGNKRSQIKYVMRLFYGL